MAPKRKSTDMQSSHSNTKKSSKPGSKPRKLSSQLHTKVPGFVVPRTVQTVSRLSNVAGVRSINDLPQDCLGSGSDVTEKQFLALRIIFLGNGDFVEFRKSRCWNAWGLDDMLEKAKRLVESDTEFNTYLRLISNRISIKSVPKQSTDWPGSLKPLKFFQEQIQGARNQRFDQAVPSSRQPSYELRSKKVLKTVRKGL
jgi:hypothetical protein